MRILHTSDWHLGRPLFSHGRKEAFDAFLGWLLEEIRREAVDILIVAGDVFDSYTPPNYARRQFYSFVSAAAKACRHIVVTGGNHDSPSFLEAPAEVLEDINVHVIGGALPEPASEVMALGGPDGVPEAIVCAVPYLRERDLIRNEVGETAAGRDRKIAAAIAARYRAVVDEALRLRNVIAKPVPIIATGHLFAAGGRASESESGLYAGSLGLVPGDAFPSEIDYLALGHLHVPQLLGGCISRRYSGSPLPLNFSELGTEKQVVLADFTDGRLAAVTAVPVPQTERLERVRGNREEVLGRLAELDGEGEPILCQIEIAGVDGSGGVADEFRSNHEGSLVEIVSIVNLSRPRGSLSAAAVTEELRSLEPVKVFDLYLEKNGGEFDDEMKEALRRLYQEILEDIRSGRREEEI